MSAPLLDFARLVRDTQGWRPDRAALLLRQVAGRARNAHAGYTDNDHLRSAAQWLGTAQDAMHDGGVSGRFSLERGWTSSYPETTGYLIPTFLDLAKEPGLAAFEERASRAIDFLLRCQLAEGAFPGGEIVENTTKPSVFNSAQIICGLVAWHRHTKDQRVLDAAVRAGDWMVSQQDADGAWRRHTYVGLPDTYSAHASCWLAELGVHADIAAHRESARRHLRWVLGFVDPETGWFDQCGFDTAQHDARIAFTHTIAYTVWGVLMTSQLLNEREGIAAAEKASGSIARRLELDRWLSGILDHRWKRRARFSCVTGAAQMALIWMRQYEDEGDLRLLNAALVAIDTVKQSQPMDVAATGVRGGIPGSDPVWGDYIRLAYPNWAAKFYVDALLAKRRALALVARRAPVEWSPPSTIPQSVVSGEAPAHPQALRVVLYASPESRKVGQIMDACRAWGFRPTAVVIENRPEPARSARLKDRVRNDGVSGIWRALARRVRPERSPAPLPSTADSLDQRAGGQPMLPRDVCRHDGIPIVETADLTDPATVAQVRALNPDLAVHAGAGILRADLLAVPRIGTLNAHMGILPRYRGMNVAEWAALEGGPVGCSVHFVEPGIDTGPILAVRTVDIGGAHSIDALRALVDAHQIALLEEVLRDLCARGAAALHPYQQAPSEGLQFFRMHPDLKALLSTTLSTT